MGDTHITGRHLGGDTHITSDMCAGIHISRGYTYHCDTGTLRHVCTRVMRCFRKLFTQEKINSTLISALKISDISSLVLQRANCHKYSFEGWKDTDLG